MVGLMERGPTYGGEEHANICTLICISPTWRWWPPPHPPSILKGSAAILAAGHVRLIDSQFKASLILANNSNKKEPEKAKARMEQEAGGVTPTQGIYFTPVMTGSEIMRHKSLVFTPVPFPYQLAL